MYLHEVWLRTWNRDGKTLPSRESLVNPSATPQGNARCQKPILNNKQKQVREAQPLKAVQGGS